MHFRFWVAAVLVTCTGALALAQKVTTPEELDKVMKRVGQANMAAGKAINSGNFAEASKQLEIVKTAVDDSREFWVLHKKDDAVATNKDVVAKIGEIQKMLATPGADGPAILAAMKQSVGQACSQCHKPYRVRDAENNWVLKPGTIGG